MKEYVAGFLFDGYLLGEVALVKKLKPEWQRGRFNGIGGKVEPGETALEAMVREFREETGADISAERWNAFCVLQGDDADYVAAGGGFKIHFFSAFVNQPLGEIVRTVEEETIHVVPIHSVNLDNAVPNLTWLIPMALSMRKDRTTGFIVTEKTVVAHNVT